MVMNMESKNIAEIDEANNDKSLTFKVMELL
jgi:hypothetical protein